MNGSSLTGDNCWWLFILRIPSKTHGFTGGQSITFLICFSLLQTGYSLKEIVMIFSTVSDSPFFSLLQTTVNSHSRWWKLLLN